MDRDGTKDWIYNALALAVIVLAVAGGAVKLVPKYRQQVSLRRQIVEREAKIRETERRTAEIGDMQRRFQTDREFVESIARQNRRVYPGEMVFLFGEERGR